MNLISTSSTQHPLINLFSDNIVLRVPVLYGEVEFESESAVTYLINQVKATDKNQSLDNYSRRYPTFTTDVGKVLAELIGKKLKV